MIPHSPAYIVHLPTPGAPEGVISCGSAAEAGLPAVLGVPPMLLPVLLVLFAGLCLLNHYRRRYAI